MSTFAPRALLVFDSGTEELVDALVSNQLGCAVSTLPSDELSAQTDTQIASAEHLVVCGDIKLIKQVMLVAAERDVSLGILPTNEQDRLRRYMGLPESRNAAIEWALRRDCKASDLVLCNGEVLLFRAVIGWLPMLDSSEDLDGMSILKRLFTRSTRLRLYPYQLLTANERKVDTAATGCMIIQRHEGDLVSRLLGKQLSVRDGKVGVLVSSPFSMMEYMKFLYQLVSLRKSSGLPNAVGYLESGSFEIDSDKVKDVYIDGELTTQTPVKVETRPAALRLNYGPSLLEQEPVSEPDKEVIRVDNLRSEKELARSIGSRVPFFSYASEERFRDLFTALNEDATTNTNYVVFMLLSTLIASLGLFLDSAAVIIGAMILAPLMAPMVSVSMALLRDNNKLLRQSLEKIGLGVALALLAAATTSAMFPHSPTTSEMLGRLSPSLPDLFVAILSGIAAAYARSYKEIAQNLAGVAIAVALVPPLSVAGIGLGRGDMVFFLQAFLLFSTNLVGIVLAATLTFRVLGFSASVHGKHGLGFVVLMLLLVTIPLGITSGQISNRWAVEEALEEHRFLIGEKEIVITDVSLGGSGILTANVLVDSPLSALDIAMLREAIHDKLQGNYNVELDVHFRL